MAERDWLTGDELDIWLKERIEETRQKQKARMAELADLGIEPAPTHDVFGAGYPNFSFSARWSDEESADIELKIMCQNNRGDGIVHIWGDEWPYYGFVIDGEALLEALALNWSDIVGGFTGVESSGEVFIDLADEIDDPDLPPLMLIIDGAKIDIATDGFRRSFDTESIMVAEVLAALGDAISERVEVVGGDASVRRIWAEARMSDDLPPCDVDRWSRGQDVPSDVSKTAAYYAKRLGCDIEDYRLAAIWMQARQTLFAYGNLQEEPDWSMDAAFPLPSGMPSRTEVMEAASEACSLADRELDEFIEEAVHERNIEARQIVLYRFWPNRYEPSQANA